MPFNLFKSSSTQLGIDIGTSGIKLVELGLEGGRAKLINYAVYEFHGAGGEADAERNILDMTDQEISAAIAQTVHDAGIKAKTTIASVSSFSTFATVIQLPYTTEEELAKTIPFEARKYVPVPLDQVVLDWSIIGVAGEGAPAAAVPEGTVPPAPPSGTTVEVFLAAVPKDETARYQRIMKAAGLDLVALELENSSLIRAVLGNDLSPTAILNIGGRATSIVIVNKGYERLSHSYEIGGAEVTNTIANALGISVNEAEALKRKYGLVDSPANKARGAMLSLVDLIVFETKKTIENFEQAQHISGCRVVLLGGLANMPGLPDYLKQKIDREVLVGNVFARLVYPPALTPLVQTLSNTLAIAVGSAMRPLE